MGKIQITVATNDYDRTRAIKDDVVEVDGCDVTYLSMQPEEIFFRAVRYAEFDVTEMSFSTHILQTQRGDSEYLGIPVFLSRVFRHSGFYIRTDRGIESGADLKGKTVGVPEYQMTAAVWQRGLLKDEYGIDPWEISWRTGGLEQSGREERTPINLPDHYDLKRIGPDQTLSAMLEAGELDAIISPPMPSCLQRGVPNVGRLWPDYRQAEQDYYRRTGLFPIMHILGVKKSLAVEYPWLPANLYKAFGKAKNLAVRDLEAIGALKVSLPWIGTELAETRELMGSDIWSYGVSENRKDIEALIRYSAEQSLTEPGLTPEDLFAETTLQTSRT
ncbi:MAG: 4,5-dihydroxyphthalate decarboxylase [Alphaproteobacteria bacterium MarineAlpha4_Bin2]|nr:MAG: 4,5-dihydroxyphthalate decarboxylase [Alphaproteobacteria bacterium MarineAlpha4_Bin2]